MTSSAPFPGEPTMQELTNPSHGVFVKLEGGRIRGMVPSFYREHPNPEEIIVKADGIPMESCGKTFTVAQVPIERRWAVLPDGEVMGELEFHKYHTSWYHEYYSELARENPDLQNVDGGKPDYDIPDPRRFVSVQVDSANPHQFVPANYRPYETAGARSKQFFTKDGDPVDEDRLKVLCNAYANKDLRAKLQYSEIVEVEQALGGGGDVATKLELLNTMLADGDLTTEQHSKRVALLTGASVPDAKPKEEASQDEAEGSAEPVETNPGEPETYTAGASCGKQYTKKTAQGAAAAVRSHSRQCSACKEASD